jgi:thiosulfate dehydrogenase
MKLTGRAVLFSWLALITAIPATAAAQGEGQQIYTQTCAACHDAGAAGAPAISDILAWQQRIRQTPVTEMERRAIHGYKSMPPKGGNAALSDAEVRRAVAYIMASIKTAAKNPASTTAPSGTTRAPLIPTTHARVIEQHAATRYHTPPSDDEIPNDKYGDDVRLGQKIFTRTYKFARRYVGNELTCANCHLDAGRRPHSAPLWAAYGMYPSYKAKNDRNNTLEERIQQCFRFSMNGISPTQDAPEVRALVSYIHFLSRGVPIGVEMPGRGYPLISKTGYDPNPSRGARVYKDKCASCHADDGGGKKNTAGDGYQFPPLWGLDSYNKGAGLARDELLAGFIKANMPLGQGWTLSDQEALDVAAYINLQLRPWDPRKGFIKGMFD